MKRKKYKQTEKAYRRRKRYRQIAKDLKRKLALF